MPNIDWTQFAKTPEATPSSNPTPVVSDPTSPKSDSTVNWNQFTRYSQPESTGEKILGTADAAASTFLNSSADAVGSIAKLASNIYNMAIKPHLSSELAGRLDEAGNKIENQYDQYRGLIAPNQYEQQQIGNHPVASGLAGGLGYVGASLGATNSIADVASKGINGALSAVVPSVAKSPVVSSIIANETLAGAMGAGADPNHPVKGALESMAYMAPFSAAAGYAGYKLKRAGDIVKYETKNIVESGNDPYSPDSIKRIQKSLKDDGQTLSQYRIKQNISDGIQQKIDELRPDQVSPEGQVATLVNRAQANYQKVDAEITRLKKPLVENPAEFEPQNYNATLSNISSGVGIQGPKLPKVGDQMNFDEMWNMRQKLDAKISQAKAMKRAGNLDRDELVPYYQLRQALSTDLHAAAENLGLGDQFRQLENVYVNQKLPFKVYNQSGELVKPEEVNATYDKISQMMTSRRIRASDVEKVQSTLGEDGVKALAWARLETAAKRSVNNNGQIVPKIMHTELRKLEATGIDNKLYNSEIKQTVAGIHTILDGADEAVKIGSLRDATGIMSKIPSLLASRPGITLIKWIGGSDTPKVQLRKVLNDLFIGTLSVSHVQNSQANEDSSDTSQ